jgi:hypothetical protein
MLLHRAEPIQAAEVLSNAFGDGVKNFARLGPTIEVLARQNLQLYGPRRPWFPTRMRWLFRAIEAHAVAVASMGSSIPENLGRAPRKTDALPGVATA